LYNKVALSFEADALFFASIVLQSGVCV